jgi:hypothetical protein
MPVCLTHLSLSITDQTGQSSTWHWETLGVSIQTRRIQVGDNQDQTGYERIVGATLQGFGQETFHSQVA